MIDLLPILLFYKVKMKAENDRRHKYIAPLKTKLDFNIESRED